MQEDSRQVAYFGPCFKRGDSAGAAKAADAALKECDKKKDDLHAGRKPRAESGGLSVKEMCNQFLHAREARCDAAR